MKAKQERYWGRSRLEWEEGERELLIAAAVARGEVTLVPSVEPETREKPNPKSSPRSEAKPQPPGVEPSVPAKSER